MRLMHSALHTRGNYTCTLYCTVSPSLYGRFTLHSIYAALYNIMHNTLHCGSCCKNKLLEKLPPAVTSTALPPPVNFLYKASHYRASHYRYHTNCMTPNNIAVQCKNTNKALNDHKYTSTHQHKATLYCIKIFHCTSWQQIKLYYKTQKILNTPSLLQWSVVCVVASGCSLKMSCAGGISQKVSVFFMTRGEGSARQKVILHDEGGGGSGIRWFCTTSGFWVRQELFSPSYKEWQVCFFSDFDIRSLTWFFSSKFP